MCFVKLCYFIAFYLVTATSSAKVKSIGEEWQYFIPICLSPSNSTCLMPIPSYHHPRPSCFCCCLQY